MASELDVDIRPYEDLTRDELHEILELRCRVFVVGQEITGVPEIDGRDSECAHAMAREGGELVGTARIFAEREPVKVGRVAAARDRQREGIGTAVMEAVQEWLGERPAELHAQKYLEDWYTSLGWERRGEEFLEAEIPHVRLVWNG